jgi:Mg-chelatase subunit ChlD
VPARTGRFRRALPVAPNEKGFDLAINATLRQATLRQVRSGRRTEGRLAVTVQDLCKKQRYRPCEHLIVLLVDASDSMGQGTEARMKAAKGAVLGLLRRAYENRSEVAMIAFGGEEARVVLPPTRSITLAKHNLERLPSGGATPFANGLFKAWQIIRCQRLKNSGVRPVLVIISDGEANVPLMEGSPAIPELFALAGQVRTDGIVSVLIDVVSEAGQRLAMRRLAAQLAASYLKVDDLKPKHILEAVRKAGGWT